MKKITKLINKAWKIYKKQGLYNLAYRVYLFFAVTINKRQIVKSDFFHKTSNDGLLVQKDCFKKNIYIITAIPYYDTGGGQRAAQLAKAFNTMGFTVRFFYAYMSRDSHKGHLKLPLETHSIIDSRAIKFIEDEAQKEDLFIFESPLLVFDPIIDIARQKGCKIVYENIDNWETSLGEDVLFENILIKLLNYSDVLVGTSQLLVEQVKEYFIKYSIDSSEKKLIYLPNAVNDELFDGNKSFDKPNDLVLGEKTFLYYGALTGEWFDWDLIINFAKKNPTYVINLIGNEGGLWHIVKKCPANIKFLGYKVQMELPAYLQYVDYAIIPFKRGRIGDFVSPIKIFEYISMYTNVICTSLPDVMGYPSVYVGDTVKEWETIVESTKNVNKKAVDEFVENNSWISRAKILYEEICTNI